MYIFSCRNRSLKPVSVLLNDILTYLKVILINYCKVIKNRGRGDKYFNVKSSEEVAQFLHSNKVSVSTTADFSTLYTNYLEMLL